MKYLFFLFTTLVSGFIVAQRPSVKFEATSPRLAKVGEVIQLRAILSGKNLPEDLKWKIGGEEGKDWKFAEGTKNTDREISVVFKKIGPTNVSLSAKATIDSTFKGKKTPDQVKISLKYDRKGYLLITEPNEYSELNQLFAEGTVDSYIKLVKKASKLTENEKYAKDPFAYIWLARGLYSVHNENLDYTIGKYEAYKTAFNDAVTALSKAMKYDNNNFLEESKFAEFIYELQFRYYDDIVTSALTDTSAVKKGKKTTKDFTKINTSLSKYLKITKNPICIKHLQTACLFNLKDANAKNILKEAEAELVKYTASKDSVKFSPTDELFFAAGVTELIKYYKLKGKTEEPCSLQKRAIAAVPELKIDRTRFEEFIDERDPSCDQ
jgi:hypothetical protein